MDATAGRLFGVIGRPGQQTLRTALSDLGAISASWKFTRSALERRNTARERG